ncbi:MAG: LCP family protein [Anaerolineales bacterium]|nr:LCP family protein [Anaerolineales bacterium]
MTMTLLRKKSVYIIVGVVLLFGVSLAAYVFVFKNWNEPLGPELELPTLTPISPSPTPTEAPPSPVPEILEETIIANPEPTSTPKPHCGGPQTMIVLAIGADSRSNDYNYGLADVLRIIRIDFVTPKVSVLSLPRDLWVEIPGISDHYGITHGKLNQAYFYGNPGMGYYDGPGAGPGLLARTLDLNFDLRVDHYIAVNMLTFVKIVDAVEGIDIYLSEAVDGRPVDDKTEDMGYFPAGQHHFSGDQALRFSRIRKRDSVFHRMDRQTQVLCALSDKLLSPSVITDIPEIVSAFYGQVLTDLSLAQLSQLICLAPKVEMKNLLFASIPREHFSQSINEEGTFIWDTDFDVIRSYIADFVAGVWPTEPKEPSCP